MSKLFSALEKRRTRYELEKHDSVSNDAILQMVEDAVHLTPSAFNAQTQRAVVLFDDQSDKFWDLTLEELRKVAPEQGFENTVAKINSFKAGNGTILYYIDQDVVESLQENFPLYAKDFPTYAQQENAMLQIVAWTELDNLGLGGSLQHYSALVEGVTQEAFNIPSTWKMVAQQPFGKPLDAPEARQVSDAKAKVLSFQ